MNRHNFLFILILCLCGCKGKTAYFETSGEVFKTGFHIKYRFDRTLGKEIEQTLARFDLSLNPFNNQSIIYKINNNIDVEVDDWFINVFNRANEISEISGGLYDITCAPFINLWGFGFSRIDSVNQFVIDSLKEFVGYGKVHLEGRKIVKNDQRLQLNASSIAKGYACDVIAEMFDSLGIDDYMIEIGGEIHARGVNSKGVCWKIEIPKPADNSKGGKNERMEVIDLCNLSIATSGNYRNYYLKNGKKIAHTINPLTGYPAESQILSASVLSTDCMTADALATTFMTMDLNYATHLADSLNIEYLFIYADKEGELIERRNFK